MILGKVERIKKLKYEEVWKYDIQKYRKVHQNHWKHFQGRFPLKIH